MTKDEIMKEIATAYRLELDETAEAWEKRLTPDRRQTMSESWLEQLERLQLMAEGNPQWDLSENDKEAIAEALRRIAEFETKGGTSGAPR